MAHCPDFSDSDSSCFSDDPDYHDFKRRTRTRFHSDDTSRELTEAEKREQQIKLFYKSIVSGDIESIIKCLDNGIEINVIFHDNWTPLLLSVSVGKPEITKLLIDRGADVNSRRDSCTALMCACNCPDQTARYSDSMKVIKLLVENGANVKTINRKRMTALMFAAGNGHLEAVQYLLPLSDEHAEDNQKWTALFWAISSNEVEVADYLLQAGLKSDTQDIRNNTPLEIARNNGFTKIIELFPDEEIDTISDILDSNAFTFEQHFENLHHGESPKFFFDICNILYGATSESQIKLLSEKNITLHEFLSITDKELEDLGVVLPYQRHRIIGGIHKFHKYPFNPKSQLVVPLREKYSNLDIAMQVFCVIRQITAMDASIRYIANKYINEDLSAKEQSDIVKNVDNIRNKIRLCKIMTNKLITKTKKWDQDIHPPDLITKNSVRYKAPWRKIVFTVSLVSLIFLFRIYK